MAGILIQARSSEAGETERVDVEMTPQLPWQHTQVNISVFSPPCCSVTRLATATANPKVGPSRRDVLWDEERTCSIKKARRSQDTD
jgi:hypothetical protein